MANNLKSNPLVFDTVGSTSAITSPLTIKKMVLCQQTTSAIKLCCTSSYVGGDSATWMVDSIIRWTSNPGVLNTQFDFPGGITVKGFYLNELGGGYLLVYTA